MSRRASEALKEKAKGWNPEESLSTNAKNLGMKYGGAFYLAKRQGLSYVIKKEARLIKLRKHEIVVYLREKGFTLEDIGRLLECEREWVRRLQVPVDII